MKKWMNAIIRWIPFIEGGRKKPFPVNEDEKERRKYCPIIIFDDDYNITSNWSAEIYILSNIKDNESLAKISYLSEEAPFNNLLSNKRFRLLEGNRFVAEGILISEYMCD